MCHIPPEVLNFIGYGSQEAPIVFFGMEEGAVQDDGALAVQMTARATFNDTMDLEEAQALLGVVNWHGEDAERQPTWGMMCAIMLGLLGPDDEAHKCRLRQVRYQAQRLGAAEGVTLLSEFLPLPKRNRAHWPACYRQYGLQSRRAYEDYVTQERQNLFRQVFAANAPRVIICYGKGFWPHYQEVFRPVVGAFNPVEGEQPIKVGHGGQLTVVLTRHFSNGMSYETVQRIIDLVPDPVCELVGHHDAAWNANQ